MVPTATINVLLDVFNNLHISLSDLLVSVLARGLENHPFRQDLVNNLGHVLDTLWNCPQTVDSLREWSHTTLKSHYYASARALTRKENGWHFRVSQISPEDVLNFRIEDMAIDMQRVTPDLWDLVSHLVSGGEEVDEMEVDGDSDDDEYFAALGDESTAPADGHLPSAKIIRRRRLKRIKTVVILSIIMHALNQQCNALGAINGIFFHSCRTPDKVIKALAHAGLSVSPPSINYAVQSLARHNARRFEQLGQSLTAAYAYDNFDIVQNTMTPTIEKSNDNLLHLTSALAFRLGPDVTKDDLRMSRVMWERSPFNPHIHQPLPQYTFRDILKVYSEHQGPTELSRRGTFIAWKFMYDLIHHGPPYFRQFMSSLTAPPMIKGIPVTKTEFLAARAMDINEARVDGNIEVIEELFAQGGVGDASLYDNNTDNTSRKIVDISEYVTLFHGDLSTVERIISALKTRSIEKTAWRRLQSVLPVPGIFHFKMACTEAIWRIFIQPSNSRSDENSLMQFVRTLRPNETGKISSKPKFRQMHEVIQHTGIVLRLDWWRVAVHEKNSSVNSLEDFAALKPSFEELYSYARSLAAKYDLDDGIDLYEQRLRDTQARDQQHENVLLLHQYFLLYEEVAWAMNAGDIGRLESTLPAWIGIFKAMGKHKYATHMTKYLIDINFTYPPRLSHAVRHSILINPTGQANQFRAVDWLIELGNLFIKDTYGGSSSNYTKHHILKESINVWLYRACARTMEQNYYLSGLSSAHGDKDMTATFARLANYMKENETNVHVPGRRARSSITDKIQDGFELIGSGEVDDEVVVDTVLDGGLDENLEADDLDAEGSSLL